MSKDLCNLIVFHTLVLIFIPFIYWFLKLLLTESDSKIQYYVGDILLGILFPTIPLSWLLWKICSIKINIKENNNVDNRKNIK